MESLVFAGTKNRNKSIYLGRKNSKDFQMGLDCNLHYNYVVIMRLTKYTTDKIHAPIFGRNKKHSQVFFIYKHNLGYGG